MDVSARHRQSLLVAAVLISVVPTLLHVFGISFATTADTVGVGLTTDPDDAQFLVLRGAFTHTLLEWTAVSAAIFTLPLAYVYTRVEGSPTVLVMAVALLSAGAIDAVHIFAADRLISGAAAPADLIPFTWAISRVFNAVILVGGVLLLGGQGRFPRHADRLLVLGSLTFLAVAAGLLLAVQLAPDLPQTVYADSVITRPFDVIPLVVFAVAGLWLFPGHYRRFPTLFSFALMVSMVPQVAAQLHMAFGSTALYDSHFNIGHFLKIGAYIFPFVGLCLDYMRAHEERAAADRAKRRFLATMSHEMRTPLNAVIGASQLLEDTRLDADQRELVDGIGAAGETLLGLVDDVLDLSRIEAGHREVANEPLDLDRIVGEVAGITRRRATDKGLTFTCTIGDDVPTRLIGDADAIRRVVLNLVDNAVKFTPDGSVATVVHRGDETIVVDVRDTGIGIPGDEVDGIFDRFRQVDSSTTRRYGGSGLGLSISRHLAEALGGSLTVRSQLGEGSVFTFTFPAVVDDEAPTSSLSDRKSDPDEVGTARAEVDGAVSLAMREDADAEPGSDQTPLPRVLVAEDVSTNWIMVERFLDKAGMSAVRAENGLEAVELMRAGGFAAVLMDIGMPEMDGYEATRAIRALESSEGREPTPVIALTAHALKEDLERALEAGCDAYLTKPVSRKDLVELLAAYLSR